MGTDAGERRRAVAGWSLGLAALLLAAALRRWVFGLAAVPTASMVPAILPGEVVLFRKGAAPALGDVVAVERGDGALHFKRVVAAAGQEVEIADGALYVDGLRLEAAPAPSVSWRDADCEERSARAVEEQQAGGARRVLPGGSHERGRVPEGAVFLLGDHRAASSDSRQWGPARLDDVLGIVIATPWSRNPCGSVRLDRIRWWP